MKTVSRGPIRLGLVMATAAALLLLLVGVGSGAFGASDPNSIQTKPKFGSPFVVDPVHTYGEPDLKIASDGTVYDSGPWGTGTQRSLWNQSTDGGHTFHTLHSPAISSPAQSDSTVPCPMGTPPPCPGGGDTEISIDRANKVYYADLAALVTLKVATWDKSSHTMNTNLIANPPPHIGDGFDRQWFAMWDPPSPPPDYTGPLPVNYLAYAEAVAGCCQAASYSTDGVNYVSPTVEYSISNDGPLAIDQKTGTVFEAVSITSTADVGVAILTRDPSTPSDPALKKAKLVKIADLPQGTTTRALFPVIAFDTARNLYVAWVTRGSVPQQDDPNGWQIWYSYSTAGSGWKTWSTPVKLSQAPSNTNVMPWATAGTSGRLAVVWYGTEDAKDNPSTDDSHQPWNVYLATVTKANSPSPTITQAQVTRHPMHYGTICLEGLGCIAVKGNRNLADFFEVDHDPNDGSIVITYDDTSNELLQEFVGAGDGSGDHRGAPVVMAVRQTSGTGLFGTPITTPKPDKTILVDNTLNDATFDPVYSNTNIPQLDLTEETVKSDGNKVRFIIDVSTLKNLANVFTATGATAIDYVMRWTGPPIDDPMTGTRNPIYYVAVEVLPDLSISYFAGQALAVELCSVSGCFPHLIDYPRPPRGGTAVTGKMGHVTFPYPADTFVITVPRSVIGNPPDGSLLESFSTFSFVRSKSAALQFTNAEGEGGVNPVMVDGICCIDAVLQPKP